MQTVTNQLPATSAVHNLQTFPPLDQVTRTAITTVEAAYYLNRRVQTLRVWSHLENGPIRPLHINGRLAWLVAEIKQLLTRGAQ